MPITVLALPLTENLVPWHSYVGPNCQQMAQALTGKAKYIGPDQNLKLLFFPEWKRFDVINLAPNGELFSLNSGT